MFESALLKLITATFSIVALLLGVLLTVFLVILLAAFVNQLLEAYIAWKWTGKKKDD